MSLRIVVHAYAKRCEQYALFLRFQLSSMVLYPPTIPVKYIVYGDKTDGLVQSAFEEFEDLSTGNTVFEYRPIDKSFLFRRSVARNEAALECEEDLIWFGDVDYFYGEHCLDQLVLKYSLLPEKDKISLIWPNSSYIHKNHEIGDAMIREYRHIPGPLLPLYDDFTVTMYSKAIGGLQMTTREYANEHGYLNETKWTKPTDSDKFLNTREDVTFRKACLSRGKSIPLKLPNLYRFRHTPHGWD